jgi:hypothetical protein
VRDKKPRRAPKPVPRDDLGELARLTGRSRDEVIETVAERAAIREYLGGYPREEAEKLALEDAFELLS